MAVRQKVATPEDHQAYETRLEADRENALALLRKVRDEAQLRADQLREQADILATAHESLKAKFLEAT